MATSDIQGMMSPQQVALNQAQSRLQIESLLDTITAESQSMLEAQTPGSQILPGTGGKTAGMIMQEQQANLMAQNQAREVAAEADWENMAVDFGQELRSIMQQKQEVTAKIVKDASVSFFDDPLTAIANAFTLPWDEQRRSAIEEREATLKKTMDNAHSHVQQSAVTADAIKKKVTAQTLAEQATALENWQKQLASQARINAAKLGMEGLDRVRAMNKDALELYMKEVQLRHGEEQMAMARRNQERQDEMWRERQKAIKDKDAAEAEFLMFANLALRSEGKKEFEDIGKLNQYKGVAGKQLEALIKRGFDIYTSGNMNHSLGTTIESRVAMMDQIGFQPHTKQQERAILMQDEAYRKVDPTVTDKKQKAIEANKIFAKDFEAAQNNIQEGSPFSAPAFSAYDGTAISRDPLWQKYVAPTLTETSSNTPVTPEFILSVANKALKERAASSSDVVSFVNSVFRQAVAVNNTVHQFEKVAGREQSEYKTRITLSPGFAGFFKDTKTVDMLDPVSVNQVLAANIVSEIVAAKPELAITAAPITANINAANLYGTSTPVSAKSIREQLLNLPPIEGAK